MWYPDRIDLVLVEKRELAGLFALQQLQDGLDGLQDLALSQQRFGVLHLLQLHDQRQREDWSLAVPTT
jgi:hypothetical protein